MNEYNGQALLNQASVPSETHWEQKNQDGTMHYEGTLGSFDYDTSQFELQKVNVPMGDGKTSSIEVLRYIGEETDGSKIQIPEGLENGVFTFMGTNITSVPKLPNSLKYADSMFQNCLDLQVGQTLIPPMVESASFMFANCPSMKYGPKVVPGTIKNANFMFAGDTRLEQTPRLGNGIQYGEFMFANCPSLSEMPKVPKSMTEYDHMTYACDGLDAVAERKAAEKTAKARAKFEKKMDQPTFRQRASSAFSAVMQCHAMRQMGYGFVMAPVMTHMMRKNGAFSKDFAGGMAAAAMTRGRGGLTSMVAAKAAANAVRNKQKMAAKKDEKLNEWDRLHGAGMGSRQDKVQATVARMDAKRDLYRKILEMSSSEKLVHQERYGGTYQYREDMMNRIVNSNVGVDVQTKRAMSKWYQEQMSAAAVYYQEGVNAIRKGDIYQTPRAQEEALAGLKEISRMQMEPLMESAQRMHTQYKIFNDGDLRQIDKLTKDMPSEKAKGSTFRQRQTPSKEDMNRHKQSYYEQAVNRFGFDETMDSEKEQGAEFM